jgi:hypothetical protein
MAEPPPMEPKPLSGRHLAQRRKGANQVIVDLTTRKDISDPKLLALFDKMNRWYFDGLLPPIEVTIEIPESVEEAVDLNGVTRFRTHRGRLDMFIALGGWLFQDDWDGSEDAQTFVENTLLHEMAHVAVLCDAIGGRHEFDRGHGQRFAAECNRVATARSEWKEVFSDEDWEARDDLELGQASAWPELGDDWSF